MLDTSILSHAFRRGAPTHTSVDRLRKLMVGPDELAVPGIVVQEMLTGVRHARQLDALDDMLAGFRVLLADRTTHVEAARLSNACRAQGIAASTVDALIAAQTVQVGGALFTLDADFARIAKHTALKLYRA